MGVAAAAALTGARRVPGELLAGCAALAVEGGAALVKSGGGSNDMLPAYLAVALLAGLALGTGDLTVGTGDLTLGAGGRAWRTTAAGLLVLAQSAVLLARFDPAQAIPTSADRAAGERLLAGMRALGGRIAVPADPGLSLLAGMAPAAQQDAAHDVLRATDQAASTSFRRSVADAVTARRFSAIITDGYGPPLGYPPWLTRYYRLCPQPLLADLPAAVFRPVAGIPIRPAAVWLPRHRGSCQTAVRTLDERNRS
jgi:hypothetical protein